MKTAIIMIKAEIRKRGTERMRATAGKKRTKIYKVDDVKRTAWMIKTFDEDRYVKVSLHGLFIRIGNFEDFKTVEELYPEIRNIVDAKGLIVAKRRNRNSTLAYCKDKGIKIPV